MTAPGPLKHLSNLLIQLSNARSLMSFIMLATAIVWQVQGLTVQLAEVTQLPILDYRTWGYTPAEAYHLFGKLGQKGIELFLQLNLLDFATPVVFGTLLSLLAGPLLKKSGLPSILNLAPFLYSIFDIAENITVRHLLHAFPAEKPKLVQLASAFTQLKYLGNIPAFGVVVLGLIGSAASILRKHSVGKQTKAGTHMD